MIKIYTILGTTSSLFVLIYNQLIFSVTSTIVLEYALKVVTPLGYVPPEAMSWVLSEDPQKWRESFNFKKAPSHLVNQRFLIQNPNTQGQLVLDPQYVVGLTEAEGCFSVYFVGGDLKVKCEFDLTLFITDLPIIEALQRFFKVGHIIKSERKASFSVLADWQLYHSIIPFFEQHALLGKKRESFFILKEVVRLKIETKLLHSKIHRAETKLLLATHLYALTVEGIRGTRKYSLEEIHKILESSVPNRKLPSPGLPLESFGHRALCDLTTLLIPFIKPHPWYVTGFCEGDGGCSATINPKKVIHTYSLCASQEEILKMLKGYFGFGKIYFVDLKNQNINSLPHWRLLINKVQDLNTLHQNQFKLYPMYCSKREYYEAFQVVVTAVLNKEHLNPVHRKKLKIAIFTANKGGHYRKNKKPDFLHSLVF